MNWKMALLLFSLSLFLSPLMARESRNKTLKLQGKVSVKTSVQMDWSKDGVAQPMIQSNSPEYPSKKIRLKREPASAHEELIIIEAP